MEAPGPDDGQNEKVQIEIDAEYVPDPIDSALSAIEGDRTIIVTDATGSAREVTFVAPEFPPTYEGRR